MLLQLNINIAHATLMPIWLLIGTLWRCLPLVLAVQQTLH